MLNTIKNFFGSTFKIRQSDGEFILRENDFGTIHLDASAIRRIVERTKVSGVHEIKNVVVDPPSREVPLNIRLNLIIQQDLSAVKLGEELRDKIKDELHELFDITVATFDIKVIKIADEIPNRRKRRVR